MKINFIEHFFENILWGSRFFVLFAVIFSLISSFILFIIGSIEVCRTVILVYQEFILNIKIPHFNDDLLQFTVQALDLYLIAIVILIFSFGLYELFISKVDVAKTRKTSNVLDVYSLDELKNKIIKVLVMILIVSFFKKVLEMSFSTPLELLYFAISIFAICFGLYYLNRKTTET